MLEKNDGMLAIVDMAISLVEFLVNAISSILSCDFSLSDMNLDLSALTDVFSGILG